MKNKLLFLMLIGLLFVVVGSAGVSAGACGTGLTEGMVSYWTFDNVSNVDGNPQDTVGSNHGINNGSTPDFLIV